MFTPKLNESGDATPPVRHRGQTSNAGQRQERLPGSDTMSPQVALTTQVNNALPASVKSVAEVHAVDIMWHVIFHLVGDMLDLPTAASKDVMASY